MTKLQVPPNLLARNNKAIQDPTTIENLVEKEHGERLGVEKKVTHISHFWGGADGVEG